MTYKLVNCVFVVFSKLYVPDDEVTLRFDSGEAAETFAKWFHRHGGDELFADWCLDQGFDHLVSEHD